MACLNARRSTDSRKWASSLGEARVVSFGKKALESLWLCCNALTEQGHCFKVTRFSGNSFIG
ncbi:MAG: hypothetical protein WBM25_15120, partial [Azonexus sp.]